MDVEKLEFKEKFIERYSKLTDWEEFKKYSLMFLRRSVRVNTLKISVEECKKKLEKNGWKLKQIPWCKEGFWILHETGRRDIGNTIEHQLGYIYVQEAVSMIPPIVLDPKPYEIVLDMCASPGSKSSQMSAMMENKGVLVANDSTTLRMVPLDSNLQRVGALNNIITLMSGERFHEFEFDKILVDAPCSGTGAIRKSLKTIETWNPHVVRRLAGLQRKLIETAFNNLKKNGVMVYSTCSVEPEEDEDIVDYLLGKYSNARLEEISLKGLKRSDCVLEFEDKKYNPEVRKCLRIWPQDNDTEGFFVSKIKKI
jgi:NOL1/NOP2/sun family putative RNA methylase